MCNALTSGSGSGLGHCHDGDARWNQLSDVAERLTSLNRYMCIYTYIYIYLSVGIYK